MKRFVRFDQVFFVVYVCGKLITNLKKLLLSETNNDDDEINEDKKINVKSHWIDQKKFQIII